MDSTLVPLCNFNVVYTVCT